MPEKKGQLPRTKKVAWGTGALADCFMNNSLNMLAVPIYNMALGVPASVIGWAMGIPRLWDAFSDPLMGHISDNARTRWGRRRPFIFLGTLLCTLCFALMWIPPAGLSVKALGHYFLILALCYYTAYTIFSVPWISLGLEISPDYHERTRVQAWRSFFNNIGGLLVASMWWLSFRLGGSDQMRGLRIETLILGSVILVSGLIPALFVRERIQETGKPKVELVHGFVTTMKNRSFLLLAGLTLMVIMGIYLTGPFEVYLLSCYVYTDAEQASTLHMVGNWFYQILSLLLIPLISFVATRIGKKQTLLIGISLAMLSYLSTWIAYNPRWPWLFLVCKLFAAPGLGCVWILTNAMLADVCDEDELTTGHRREGMYTAVYGWLVKLGFSLVFILCGYMAAFSGYDPALKGNQPAEVIFKMRLLLTWVPTAILLIAGIMTALYSITETRAHAIRAELERRRGTV